MANESSANPQPPPPGNVQVAVLPLATYQTLVGRVVWDFLSHLGTLPPDAYAGEVSQFLAWKRDLDTIVDVRWEETKRVSVVVSS